MENSPPASLVPAWAFPAHHGASVDSGRSQGSQTHLQAPAREKEPAWRPGWGEENSAPSGVHHACSQKRLWQEESGELLGLLAPPCWRSDDPGPGCSSLSPALAASVDKRRLQTVGSHMCWIPGSPVLHCTGESDSARGSGSRDPSQNHPEKVREFARLARLREESGPLQGLWGPAGSPSLGSRCSHQPAPLRTPSPLSPSPLPRAGALLGLVSWGHTGRDPRLLFLAQGTRSPPLNSQCVKPEAREDGSGTAREAAVTSSATGNTPGRRGPSQTAHSSWKADGWSDWAASLGSGRGGRRPPHALQARSWELVKFRGCTTHPPPKTDSFNT
ncbi:uncharacterized protein LOC119514552 isoform X1 [Choloepus didactylus]|uniref:uncharacterized protein LOC119514552 isoform X1 n=1 Tax=Choloepus didactylus TaxID=27675 RepID=UPI00189E1D63|nr:uncharacterized protein LOC119514552 isoform X1 [Choloepus didactylus]